MRQMPISKFKATCLAEIDRIYRHGEPLLITRHGQPLAEVQPVKLAREHSLLGCMEGTMEIIGDIESPTLDIKELEAMIDEDFAGHSHLVMDSGSPQEAKPKRGGSGRKP